MYRRYFFYYRGWELRVNVFWGGGRYNGGEVFVKENVEVG